MESSFIKDYESSLYKSARQLLNLSLEKSEESVKLITHIIINIIISNQTNLILK